MVIFAYITILGLIKVILPSKIKANNFFVFLASIMLFFISGLRSSNFANDTSSYIISYTLLQYKSLSELWMNTIMRTGKDPLFHLFSKIISLMGANYQIWLAIIAGIFIYSISKLIKKYSNEPYISFIAFISLGYFYFSLTGLRQTMALAMVILSYKYLRERKLLQFILFVLFGSMFHSSAIIFLIAYPFANMKVGRKQIVGIMVSFILAYFFKQQVRIIINYFNTIGQYQNYNTREITLTFSGFIIQLFIYLFCLGFKDDILERDNKNLNLYNLLFLGLVFQSFASVIAEFFRVSMYFSIFGIILIPKALEELKDKYLKTTTYLLVLIALVAYIFISGSFSGFEFYWQG